MATIEELATELGTLKNKVRELEDREQIRILLREYARTLDAFDLHAFSLLFSREGSWVGGQRSACGPENIQSMLEGSLTDNNSPRGPILYHLTTDPVITVDGDQATATSFWLHIRRNEENQPTVPTLGHYDDELVREDGRWLFAERRVSGLMRTAGVG